MAVILVDFNPRPIQRFLKETNATIVLTEEQPGYSILDNIDYISPKERNETSPNKTIAIFDNTINELKSDKKIVIITERKEHIDSLYQYLKQSYEAITLSGEDSESAKNSKWKLLKEGNYQVLITPGQFFS